MAEKQPSRSAGMLWVGLILALFAFFWWLVEANWSKYMTVSALVGLGCMAAAIVAGWEGVRRFLAAYWLAMFFVVAVVFTLVAPGSWIEGFRPTKRIPGWLAHVLFLFLVQGAAVLVFAATRKKGDFAAERGAAAANVTFLLQVGVGLLVLVNVISANWLVSVLGSIDTTETGVYSLGDRTRGLLDGLKDLPGEVQATYLDFGSNYRARPGEEPLGDRGKEFLKQYGDYSPKLRVTILDAIRDKKEVEDHLRSLGIDETDLGNEDTVIFTYRKPGETAPKRKNVTVSSWSFLDTSQLDIKKFKGEEKYTEAIQDVIYPKKKVYFLKGHGEHPLSGSNAVTMSEAADVIRRLALETEDLSLVDRGSVPSDASLVVIPGPKTALSEKERESLLSWLDAGGSLMLLTNVQGDLLTEGNDLVKTGLEDWLADMGIVAKPDYLCMDYDVAQSSGGGWGAVMPTSVVLTADYSKHDIVKDLAEKGYYSRFFEACPVLVERPKDAFDLKVEELVYMRRYPPEVQNPPTTYAAKLYPGRDPRKDDWDNDIRDKHISIGVAAEKKLPAGADGARKAVRVVVFGDSKWATTLGLSDQRKLFAPGHASLFANAVSWAVDREELISIEPKTLETERVPLTDRQSRLAKTVGLFALPTLVLILGLYVAWNRRR